MTAINIRLGAVLLGCLAWSGVYASTFTVLHQFDPAEAQGSVDLVAPPNQFPISPIGPFLLASASSGGIAVNGGSGTLMTLYPDAISPSTLNPVNVDYNFASTPLAPQAPAQPVFESGVRYGATQVGNTKCGAKGGICGSIFTFNDQTGAFNTLHDFTGGAAGVAASALQGDGKGSLVGVSSHGGILNRQACLQANAPAAQVGCGFVFRLTPGSPLQVLHYFTGGSAGSHPFALVQRSDGTLIGGALDGAGGDQILFSLTPSGAYRVLAILRSTTTCAPDIGSVLIADTTNHVFFTENRCGSHQTGTAVIMLPATGASHIVS